MATNVTIFMDQKLVDRGVPATDLRFDNELLPKGSVVLGFMKIDERGVVVETIDDYYSKAFSTEQYAQFEKVLVFARAVLLGCEDWLLLEIEADLL